LIAEEVACVLPELVPHSTDGQIETVKYHILPTLLIAEGSGSNPRGRR
jgi:hypothetical protein